MGRSRFPGKPLKFQNRKRISVLSGAVYHETNPENHSTSRSSAANDFAGEKEEEEKKENNSENDENATSEDKTTNGIEKTNPDNQEKDPAKSPVRTRSQNKMEPPKNDKPKPVKKTVTFGTVESCEDIFLPLKKVPIKHHAPLVSIIKKKSSLKQTEYSTFNSILKPAKLTDLSSKSSSDYQEGYLRKNLNPLSKPINKFSQFTETRSTSPPPRNLSPTEKESGNSQKYVLPVRSSHSSRVIKPNKRFIDGDEQMIVPSSLTSGKVLKKPKLKRLVFNNLHNDEDTPDEEESDRTNDSEKAKDKHSLASNLFKDKTTNSFSNISSTGSRKAVRDFFSYEERDKEYSPDENSNVETLEKLKSPEPNKEERSGHAMRKLMDISDASSSTSSSGSESEESWESDSLEGSGEEGEKQPPASPEKDKSSASQLLSGKVIIREARLQLTTPAPSSAGLDGPFSALTTVSSNNPPATVTCGVCGAVRFYRFVRQARKFGIYSCESCRKFISKLLKKDKMVLRTSPVVTHCVRGEGNCHVPPVVRSQQWKLLKCTNKSRCPACWLKLCLKAFQVPPHIRATLTAMLPPYMRSGSKPPGPLTQANPLKIGSSNTSTTQSTFNTLGTENENNIFAVKTTKKSSEDIEKSEEKEAKQHKDQDPNEENNEDFSTNRKRRLTRIKVRKKDKDESKQAEDPKRQKMELKGPRVKHVCRSASIVLGQPIATFPTPEEKEKNEKTISDEDGLIMPVDEKDKVTPDMSSCDSEVDNENKSQVVPEVSTKETDPEVQIEPKKRKVEVVAKQSKDSSEDETIMDLVPRKSTLKPFTNITNVRGRAQKCGQNRPELICVDFWESYDPDEVCNSGFGLIGTIPFTIAKLCFLCGSAGREKMLVCGSCCEWYHVWCAEEAGGGGAWTCARCVWCAACARPAVRLL